MGFFVWGGGDLGIVINTVPYRTVRAKKRYTLISEIVLVKYQAVPNCTAKYRAVPIFSVKYGSLYVNLNKLSNFYILIFFIF